MDDEDEQLALALSLSLEQNNQSISDKVLSEDLALAQCLQHVEDEESDVRASYIEAASRQQYEKVTSARQHMLQPDSMPLAPPGRVHSTAWTDAVALERKALEKGQAKLPVYTRHEPLMQSLQTTQHLTELEGAGDLYGSKILVSKEVGQDLRTFVRREEKKAATRRHQQSKAAAPTAASAKDP